MELKDYLKMNLMSVPEFAKKAKISHHTVYKILREPNCKLWHAIVRKILEATKKQVDLSKMLDN